MFTVPDILNLWLLIKTKYSQILSVKIPDKSNLPHSYKIFPSLYQWRHLDIVNFLEKQPSGREGHSLIAASWISFCLVDHKYLP